jgi:hypothetical protein
LAGHAAGRACLPAFSGMTCLQGARGARAT